MECGRFGQQFLGWRCGFNHHQQRTDRRDNRWPKRHWSDVLVRIRQRLCSDGQPTGSPSGKHSWGDCRRCNEQSWNAFRLQQLRDSVGLCGHEQRLAWRLFGHRHDRPYRGKRLCKRRLHRNWGYRLRWHFVGHTACLRDCGVGFSPSRRRWSDDSANGAAGDDAHQYRSDRWGNV